MKIQLLTIAIFAVIPLIISCEKKGDTVEVAKRSAKLELLKEELESVNHLASAHYKQSTEASKAVLKMSLDSYVDPFTPSEQQMHAFLKNEFTIKKARYDEVKAKQAALIAQIQSYEPNFINTYSK